MHCIPKSSERTVIDADELELARLGYKQEFKRAFTPWELFGIVFSIIGVFPSMSSVLTYAVPNGGPVAMVWGWAVAGVFITFIGLAIAELGSAAPTSGGLYYWSFKFSSPRWRRLLSWIVGYSNSIGLIAGLAACDWGCAVQVMAAVSIGHNEQFSATTGQRFGVFICILILHATIGSLATRVIARLQSLYIVLNVLLCLVIIIGVPAATPREYWNTAEYSFTAFVNTSGWTDGFAFVLSFLSPLWTVCGFDSPLHISEEASNASTAVPWAVMNGTVASIILGFAINLALVFRMGTNLDGIMSSPINQPMAAILFQSFGQKGTLAIWSVVVAVQFMVGSNCLVAISRQMFAFSRDGGFPFSRYLYRINKHTQTPVNCAWASAFIAFLLGLLVFAGDAAVSAIFSLGVVGVYLAYIIPIVARFAGGGVWTPGPFNLGKMGAPVAMTAVAWMIFAIVILLFPTSPGPTGTDMNYTIAVLGAWISFCLLYYYFPRYGGVYWFQGPIANIEGAESPVSDSDEVAKGDI